MESNFDESIIHCVEREGELAIGMMASLSFCSFLVYSFLVIPSRSIHPAWAARITRFRCMRLAGIHSLILLR